MDFGIIFHFGLYSIHAFDDPNSIIRRTIQNGSEWYQKRLEEKGTYRPISGWKETQKYHKINFKDGKYEDFMKDFIIDKWEPEVWMKLCKEIGAKYVILTSKHHDGFCLYPTKTTKFRTERDIVGEFCLIARKYDLKVGIYYSWYEFNQTCTKKYMDNIISIQVEELSRNNPDIWWFDGDWACKTKYAKEKVRYICEKLKKMNSNIKINDRVCDFRNGTYRVFKDRYIPEEKDINLMRGEIKSEWEHINTIGLSWGYNKVQDSKLHYKSPETLYELYKKVKGKNGKFLLNLAPDSSGNIDVNEVRIIKEFGKLIKRE